MAFADDNLMFLFSPHISVPNLTATLRKFSNISQQRINETKSMALNIAVPLDMLKLLQTNYPNKWTKHLPCLYQDNYPLPYFELYISF